MSSMVLPPPLLKVADVVIDIRPLPDAEQSFVALSNCSRVVRLCSPFFSWLFRDGTCHYLHHRISELLGSGEIFREILCQSLHKNMLRTKLSPKEDRMKFQSEVPAVVCDVFILFYAISSMTHRHLFSLVL